MGKWQLAMSHRQKTFTSETFNTEDTRDYGVILGRGVQSFIQKRMLMKFDLTGGRKEGSNRVGEYTH
jgi:hypothetical protein